MTPDEKVELYQIIRNIRWRYQLDQKFENPAVADVLEYVNKARQEITDSLGERLDISPDSKWTDRRNAELLDELNELTVGLKDRLGADVEELATVSFEKSVEAHNSIMSLKGAAANVQMLQLSADQIQSFLETPVGGRQLHDWVNRTFDYPLQERLSQELGAGMFRGESYRTLRKRVDQALGEAADNSETLVRSWVQAANVNAQRRVQQANREILRGWTWNASLENADFGRGTGTCLRCLALDSRGEVYPIDGGPEIPLHPSCRCVAVPKSVSYKELGLDIPEIDDALRNANVRGTVDPLTGQIKRGKTGVGGQPLLSTQKVAGGFDEFMATLPEQVQRDTLGPKRFELWKQGKIKLEDLATATGRQKTIRELK